MADDINAVISGELGFARDIDSAATRFFQLSSVISERRGSCLGLGALYLAIGERMGVPLDGILLPGHFFVPPAIRAATTSSCSVAERPCRMTGTEKVRALARSWLGLFPSSHGGGTSRRVWSRRGITIATHNFGGRLPA